MKNIKVISKENITAVIRRFNMIFFIAAVIIFVLFGIEYRSVLAGPRDFNDYTAYLKHEDTTNLNSLYVNVKADNIKDYFVTFKEGSKEVYYYMFEEPTSGLLVSVAVDDSLKPMMDQAVLNQKEINVTGSISMLNNTAVDVGKLTIEGKEGIVGDNIWSEVSPYVIMVNQLPSLSVNSGKVLFYSSLIVSLLGAVLDIYLRTKFWTKNKVFMKEARIKHSSSEAASEIQEVEVMSKKQNRVLMSENYIFYRENFYFNSYRATKISDIRWVQIRKVFSGKSEYVFFAIDKDANEVIIGVARGQREMEVIVDRVIRSNDKIVLGEISEITEKKLTMKKDKDEMMRIIEREYKSNKYKYMKEKK